MNGETLKLLEYDRIIEKLAGFAVSEPGKKRVLELKPSINQAVVETWLNETAEARAIVDCGSSVPLPCLTGILDIMAKPALGMILTPEELTQVGGLLAGGKRLKRFLQERKHLAPSVSSYALSLSELEDLAQEINRCIRGGLVNDKASPELGKIRKKISILEERIKSKLEAILKSPSWRPWLQDSLVSTRQGRYVIPVKSEYRRNVRGQVLDTSASGATVFIEPAEISGVQEELNLLRIMEEKEVYRILTVLTGLVESHQMELSVNLEALTQIDFALAKGKFSRALGGSRANVNTGGFIELKGGRHPLLGTSAVPLDLTLGGPCRALVITGPNTGGKTVALKTVGLLTLMVQAGLQPPAEDGSIFAIFHEILADIGDGQSIEQSLSTFSSHIRNIAGIIGKAGPRSLLILDELGAGTEPQEGTGLAIAILERIYESGATLVATTHYNEIKTFAAGQPGYAVGCMEFDLASLRPLYRLHIGQAGESNALLIALRLGMDRRLIERAHQITYHETREYLPPQIEAALPADPAMAAGAMDVKAEADGEAELGRKIEKARKEAQWRAGLGFKVGDCVFISSMGRTGIVYEEANGKGEVGVMVMKRKIKVNQKRLSLHVEAEKLYPENYDLDIVFESKENRKKRKIMSKRHEKGLTVHCE